MPKVDPETAIEIVYHAPKSLIPNPRNARTHTAETIGELAGIIQTFGWTQPILIDDARMIIAGHRRQKAALLLGLKRVPCIDLSRLSENDRRAYMLADNRAALNAGWDAEMLGAELRELAGMNNQLAELGFSQAEIDQAIGGMLVDNPDDEWQGMPEFVQDEIDSFRKLIVHFRSQEDVDEAARLLKVKLTDATKYCWFPELEKNVYADKGYQMAEQDGAT